MGFPGVLWGGCQPATVRHPPLPDAEGDGSGKADQQPAMQEVVDVGLAYVVNAAISGLG